MFGLIFSGTRTRVNPLPENVFALFCLANNNTLDTQSIPSPP
jgi:hypothetical protein